MTRMMCVCFTELHGEGETFQQFPQHITLVPWFNGEASRVQQALIDSPEEFRAVPALIGNQELFGLNADIPVWRVGGIVEVVHEIILRRLSALDIHPENPNNTGKNYQPHITIKPGQPTLRTFDTILVDHIAIVDELEDKARRIARIINLRRV